MFTSALFACGNKNKAKTTGQGRKEQEQKLQKINKASYWNIHQTKKKMCVNIYDVPSNWKWHTSLHMQIFESTYYYMNT